MDRLLDPGLVGLLVPIVGTVGLFAALIVRRVAWHKQRMAMIEQGLDPDESGRLHKERMAMIKQGMHPDRPEPEDGDLEHQPEVVELERAPARRATPLSQD